MNWQSPQPPSVESAVGGVADPLRLPAPPGETTTEAVLEALPGAVDQELAAGDRRGYVLRRLLAISDLVALGLALAAAFGLGLLLGRAIAVPDMLAAFAVVLPLWIPIAVSARLYHVAGRSAAASTAEEFGAVFRVATTWSWFILLARAAVDSDSFELLLSFALWALAIPLVLLGRACTRRFARSRPWYRQNTLIVGTDEDCYRIETRIRRHPDWGLRLVGRTDRPSSVLELAETGRIARVILAGFPHRLTGRTELARTLSEAGVQVDLVAGDAEVLRSGADLHELEGLPIVSMPAAAPPRSVVAIKRCFDLAVALPAVVLLAPVFAYCALRVRLESPGPVFFRQQRVGKDGRAFPFVKFRSMVDGADSRLADVASMSMHGTGRDSGMFKAVDDPRVTKFGATLRRWSLDELPQLWNVIRGDMSLVGPRPLPVFEAARIDRHYTVRHQMRPGITGAWQVMGRSDIPFEDMLRLDYAYVMNWSFSEDLKLLVRTAAPIVGGRGAY